MRTWDMTEEKIKKLARDPQKFYWRICMVLNKYMSLVHQNIDPDLNPSHPEVDGWEVVIQGRIGDGRSLADECLESAVESMMV